MEMEFNDGRGRGRFVIVMGLILAVVAGGAAFFLISQAQQQAAQSGATRRSWSRRSRSRRASRSRPPTWPFAACRSTRRTPRACSAIPTKVIGLVPGVAILEGQPVYANFLASQAQGGEFSILEPGETIAPDSEAWRAVSLTVPDDRAVGGLVRPGDTVDVFVTATVTVPDDISAPRPHVHRQVDQDHLPGPRRAGQGEHVLRDEGAGRAGRGDQPPPGERRGGVQPRPPPAAGRPLGRRLAARRDDEPDHPALRAADPADVPVGQGRAGRHRRRPRSPSPSPSPSRAAAARPRAPAASASASARSTLARTPASDPLVSIVRVATGRTRSTQPGLRRDPALDLGRLDAPPGETRPLRGRIADDEPDLVEQVGVAALDEPDRLDDDGRRRRRARPPRWRRAAAAGSPGG